MSQDKPLLFWLVSIRYSVPAMRKHLRPISPAKTCMSHHYMVIIGPLVWIYTSTFAQLLSILHLASREIFPNLKSYHLTPWSLTATTHRQSKLLDPWIQVLPYLLHWPHYTYFLTTPLPAQTNPVLRTEQLGHLYTAQISARLLHLKCHQICSKVRAAQHLFLTHPAMMSE